MKIPVNNLVTEFMLKPYCFFPLIENKFENFDLAVYGRNFAFFLGSRNYIGLDRTLKKL